MIAYLLNQKPLYFQINNAFWIRHLELAITTDNLPLLAVLAIFKKNMNHLINQRVDIQRIIPLLHDIKLVECNSGARVSSVATPLRQSKRERPAMNNAVQELTLEEVDGSPRKRARLAHLKNTLE